MLFPRGLLATALLMVVPQLTVSAEVYKWVDEAGNVHFGDSISDQYRQAGEAVDLSGNRPSEAERRQAEAIADSARQAADSARERRLDAEERLESAAEQSGEPLVPKEAGTPIQPKPGQARLTREQRMKNYEAEMGRYRESIRCFAKYQMKGGGTRGYAFDECESVKKTQLS